MTSPITARPTARTDWTAFMLEISDLVSGTLDLDQVLKRVADVVRRVINYEFFAILLVNERSQDLGVRFSVGHQREVVDSVRVKAGEGITGLAASTLQPQLVNDVRSHSRYIPVRDDVHSELAVPIVWNRAAIGVMDLQSVHPGAFTPDQQDALVLVASRIASAIENARLYRNAVNRERTLALLNDIAREVTSILTLDELLQRTAELVRRVIDYQLFSILLLNPAGDKLEHRASVKFGQNVQIKHDVPLDKGIVGAAALSRQPVVVGDVHEDSRYLLLNPESRSELAVPLIYQDKTIGVLDLEHTRRGYFTERHARTLSTLAAQLSVAIVNARLYDQLLRAERRMERDLHLAQQIQRNLLPGCCPSIPGLEISARSVPARELGGDLYDFIAYKKQRWAIAVGDVSGKGTGAALYGAVVSGILRIQAAIQPGPAELLSSLNHALVERRIEAQFMTLSYALWEPRGRKLTLSNSGLPFPIHCCSEGCRTLKVAGVPLGMMPDTRYEEIAIQMAPGDIVAFVSDGITEFTNGRGEEFGRIRLEHLLSRHRGDSAEQIIDAIFADSEHFGGGARAADDRTALVLKAS